MPYATGPAKDPFGLIGKPGTSGTTESWYDIRHSLIGTLITSIPVVGTGVKILGDLGDMIIGNKWHDSHAWNQLVDDIPTLSEFIDVGKTLGNLHTHVNNPSALAADALQIILDVGAGAAELGAAGLGLGGVASMAGNWGFNIAGIEFNAAEVGQALIQSFRTDDQSALELVMPGGMSFNLGLGLTPVLPSKETTQPEKAPGITHPDDRHGAVLRPPSASSSGPRISRPKLTVTPQDDTVGTKRGRDTTEDDTMAIVALESPSKLARTSLTSEKLGNLCEAAYHDSPATRVRSFWHMSDIRFLQKFSTKDMNVWYHPADSTLVIVFRGTENFKDIVTDVELAFGLENMSYRYLKTEFLLKSKSSKNPLLNVNYKHVIFTGHSLGGALAIRMFSLFPRRAQCITFNPGVTLKTLPQFRKTLAYCVKGDVVSLIAQQYGGSAVRYVYRNPSLKKHTILQFTKRF